MLMPPIARRMIGLVAGYALAVIVASVTACALLAAWAAIFRPGTDGLFATVIISGIAITASTAWPGYLVTTWLLLSKKIANTPWRIALYGALTAVQALLMISFFVGSVAHASMWAPSIVGGFVGALIFSFAAETLFGMRLNGPSLRPSPSKS